MKYLMKYLVKYLGPSADQTMLLPLSQKEISNHANLEASDRYCCARNLQFRDPSGGPFTVTYNVIGNLARSSGGSGSMSSTATGGGEGGGGSGGAETLSVTDPVTSLMFKVTYNPLLNMVTVQLIQP